LNNEEVVDAAGGVITGVTAKVVPENVRGQ
jgi:hypothetical protein